MASKEEHKEREMLLPAARLRLNSQKPKRGKVWSLVALGLSEAFGTALLVLFGCMGGLPGFHGGPPSHLQACLTFGLVISAIIQIFGHVSGAHLNPAVTVAAWVFGLVNVTTAALYIAAQFIGATLGYATLVIVTPEHAFYKGGIKTNETHEFCATTPGSGVSDIEALLGEFVATSVLILLCCGVWDRRNSLKQDGVPIKFGLTIAALALAEGPYSGCSMNPARTFGPALITGVWRSQWLYWIAPMTAGILMAYLYKFVFDVKEEEPEADNADIPLNHKPVKESTENLPTV